MVKGITVFIYSIITLMLLVGLYPQTTSAYCGPHKFHDPDQNFNCVLISSVDSVGGVISQSQTGDDMASNVSSRVDIEREITKATNGLVWVGVAINSMVIMFAGYLYMTSEGDDKRMKNAKGVLIASIAGVFFLLASQALNEVITSVQF